MRSLSVYYFLYFLALSVYAPFLSLYFDEQGFSSTAIGIFLSVWAFAGVVSPPVMGMLNDRLHDPLRLLKIITVVSPVIGLGFYFFEGYFVFLLLAVLFSWFQNPAIPLSDAIAVEVGRRDGFSFSSVRLWGALSYSVGAFIVGFVYDRTEYGASFLIFAAVSVPLFFSLLKFPKMKPAPGTRTSLFEQIRHVAGNKTFLLFVFVGFLFSGSMAVNMTFLPLYYKEMGFDKGLAGTAYAIAALVEVPVFWYTSRIVGRFGRFPVLCFAASCYAVKCLSLFLFHDVYLALSLQVLDGISYALFAGVAVEVVAGLAGEKTKATSQAVFAAGTYGLGGIIGNAAGGAVLDEWGAAALYLVLAILCAVAALMYMTVYRERETAPA